MRRVRPGLRFSTINTSQINLQVVSKKNLQRSVCKMAAANKEQKVGVEEGEEFEFHGDILETLLSHVPLIHLVPASHVSKSWRAAVSSSLRHPRPWLILHAQSTRSLFTTTSHAYDPRSDIWIHISHPPINYIPDLKSSHSNFLYMLSNSQFSFSFDPLNIEWYRVKPPLVWRYDPIVARVGNSVVIAGGGCDFGDDPLAVEIYDLSTRLWHSCDQMPLRLRETMATPYLSIAATAERLIVTDKESGETHWFDPGTKFWSGSFDLCTGQPVTSYHIGSTDNTGLILIGLCKIQNVERVKIWKLGGENFECEEMGEMPGEYVEKLRKGSCGKCSINTRVAGNVVYVYNDVGEVVACELIGSGVCRWWRVRNVEARGGLDDRVVFTCSVVGIDDLHKVMRAGSGRFEVIDE
ncbi:hypothetical protein ACS0TY_010152 [Phlomoides rotata]